MSYNLNKVFTQKYATMIGTQVRQNGANSRQIDQEQISKFAYSGVRPYFNSNDSERA